MSRATCLPPHRCLRRGGNARPADRARRPLRHAGPSGAPTRGRPDVLPTGRNFYSVDTRAVPTPAAWELGRKSAELLVARYRQDHGDWPRALALSAWGTANMRTGGDDIAQALALIGARPLWEPTLAPRHRLRDHHPCRTRPPARRCDLAHLGLLPRCLSDPDRPVRQRRPRRRRARRGRRRQPRRRAHDARNATAARRGVDDESRRPGARAIACSDRSPAPMAPACRR